MYFCLNGSLVDPEILKEMKMWGRVVAKFWYFLYAVAEGHCRWVEAILVKL